VSTPTSLVEVLRWRVVAVAVTALLGGSSAAGADQQSPPAIAAAAGAGSTASFDAFRFIGEGNIFDPNRVGRSADEPPPQPVETISLVGTMQYTKGLFAFFDSPDSNYRKALHEGDTIAQFTVKRITTDGVELTRDAQQISLTIGQQLRRLAGGDWAVGAATRADRAPVSGAAPPIPADASETLRRLMEQRQKQLRQ
jgi:hypothetical protein